ncbi:hypothetical protein E2320_007911 [Naja naja]|nr:hypothetical protein E2320_007911 [Naja naja]
MPSFLKRALYISIRYPMTHNTIFFSYLSLRTLKPLHHAAPLRKYCSRTNKDTVDMSLFPAENIRNFSIVAHVDHGKSTLADRLLEITVERERGITVKAQTASLIYNHQGTNYLLNLIDTPGHVDFNYEVSRSLSACQGVLLVVDANQGIQAQTVANFYLAYEAHLSIIPIDLKNADPEMVENQIENTFDILKEDCIRLNSEQTPVVDIHEPLKALVFDSTFDTYRGVIANIALFSGEIHKGHKITTSHTKKVYEVNEVGILTPDEQPTGKLYAGQVGYMIAGMREIMDAQIGDTVYLQNQPVEPFPGFKSAKPMVFAVFNQRLEQEHNASVILTAPTVPYKAILSSPKLIKTRRAVQKDMVYMDEHRVMMIYLFPLNEIVKAYSVGKSMCERLRDLIPRQMFEIAIQAGLSNKIIARETVKAFRKDVLAKCRQAEGKKKMRRIGNVEVPKDAFIKVLKKQLDR